MYHIVERKFCRCGRFPPEVRTAIPVDGRFEHIVLSCNATSDHGIIWIERESEKALQILKEGSVETITSAPKVPKMERLQTIKQEHKDALERAVSLNIPHAVSATEEEEPSGTHKEESAEEISITAEPSEEEIEEDNGKEKSEEDASKGKETSSKRITNWDELAERLFKKDETGQMVLNRDVIINE
nr:sn1-specific diacylglycerol lipase alpha isoform X1 [Ipomoea batatas]